MCFDQIYPTIPPIISLSLITFPFLLHMLSVKIIQSPFSTALICMGVGPFTEVWTTYWGQQT